MIVRAAVTAMVVHRSLTAIAVLCTLCSASPIVVERFNTSRTDVIRCPYDPPTVNGHPAFGLLLQARCHPDVGLVLQNESDDAALLDSGTPGLATLLGANGTAVLTSGHDVLFRGIGGTTADITQSMEVRSGWTVVLLVRLFRRSEGPLMALFDDNGSLTDAADLEAALRNCSGESCAIAGLFVSVMVKGESSLLRVILPDVLSRTKAVASFTVPTLFDGGWHLLGVVAEPMAAGYFVKVSLHVDGVDPSTAGLELCHVAGAPKRLMTTPLTPWNTTRGALSVGGAVGSYHALLLYNDALSRQAIAAFGTTATKEAAAGGSRSELLAVCFTVIAVAVALTGWTVAHAYREAHSTTTRNVTTSDNNMVVSFGDVAKKASAGAPQAAQISSTAATAVSSIRASTAPAAAVVVSITSIGFEVPQQTSAMFSHMTFPTVFRDVFGNLFNMWSIRFDFPEVAVPPYAPLLVVLVGLIVVGVAAVWQTVKDRKQFAASVQNWNDRKASYRILLRYIVRGVFEELSIVVDESDSDAVVAAMVKEFPTPAGSLPATFFKEILRPVVSDAEQLTTVSKALHRRCEHLLEVIPADTVTTLCMCMIPQINSRVVSLAEVSAMSMKLQTMTTSFDRALRSQSSPQGLDDHARSLAMRLASLAAELAADEVKETDSMPSEHHPSVRCPLVPDSRQEDEMVLGGTGRDSLKHDDAEDDHVAKKEDIRELETEQDDEWSTVVVSSDVAENALANVVASRKFKVNRVEDDDDDEKEELHEPEEKEVIDNKHEMKETETDDELETEQEDKRRSAGKNSAPFITEAALLAHINTFIRAVLMWVVEPTGAHLKAFADPFLEFHCQRSLAKPAIPSMPLRRAGISEKSGLLQSLPEAAAVYTVFRVDEAAMSSDKAPQHDRQTVPRKYHWFDGNEVLLAWEVQYRMLIAPSARGIRRVAPTTAAHCCPLHSSSTVVKANESHLSSTTLDGRPMYRCCNASMDRLKEAMHGEQHSTGDECDDGEVFICPETTCGFAICGRCLRREVGALDMARVHVAGLAFNLRHLSPPLSSTLSVVVLDALLFPVTQIPLLVLTCSPSISCWLRGCYTAWSVEFGVSFGLAVLLLTLRIATGVWLCAELRERQLRCEDVVRHEDDDSLILVDRNLRWEYFVNHCDRSLLRSMYVSTELSYIAWGPAVKLVFDVALVLAVSLSPMDSTAQRTAVGAVYAARGVLLCLTNPNLMLALDVLAKAVVVHQLLMLGLSSAAVSELVRDGVDNSSTAILVVMLIVTCSFLVLVAVVMWRTLVSPLLDAMWNESMSALVRRDAQSAMLHSDFDALQRTISMQINTLHMKRQLCATTLDGILLTLAMVRDERPYPLSGLCHTLPFPRRGGTQVAIAAAMVLQTASKLQQQSKESPTKVNACEVKISDEHLEMVVDVCHTFLVDWLSIVTSCGGFHDPDDSAFSLSTRQLLDHERDAIGHFLQHTTASSDSHRQPGPSHEELLRRFAIFRKSPNSQQHSADNNGAVPGPLTHCNQLQLLSAARLTDRLDFSDCSLRGCRLVKGTRITRSNARDSDLSHAVMPQGSLVACDTRGSLCRSASFCSTAETLTLSHFPVVNSVAFSPDGSRIASGAFCHVWLWDASSGAELQHFYGHSDDVNSVVFSPGGSCIVSGGKDNTVQLWDASSCAKMHVFTGHSDMIHSVAFSPDGSRIVSGSDDTVMLSAALRFRLTVRLL